MLLNNHLLFRRRLFTRPCPYLCADQLPRPFALLQDVPNMDALTQDTRIHVQQNKHGNLDLLDPVQIHVDNSLDLAILVETIVEARHLRLHNRSVGKNPAIDLSPRFAAAENTRTCVKLRFRGSPKPYRFPFPVHQSRKITVQWLLNTSRHAEWYKNPRPMRLHRRNVTIIRTNIVSRSLPIMWIVCRAP